MGLRIKSCRSPHIPPFYVPCTLLRERCINLAIPEQASVGEAHDQRVRMHPALDVAPSQRFDGFSLITRAEVVSQQSQRYRR